MCESAGAEHFIPAIGYDEFQPLSAIDWTTLHMGPHDQVVPISVHTHPD